MERFRHGNCQDACAGTLLGAVGVADPAAVLFRRLTFQLGAADESAADGAPAAEYADSSYFAEVSAATGAELVRGRARGTEELLALADRLLADGVAVAVAVDHHAYPHSQYRGLAHRPHFVILAGREPGAYRYVDPFPRYDVGDVAAVEEVRRWCASPILPEAARGEYFYAAPGAGPGFEADEYRRAVWAATLAENVEAMLADGPGGGATGVAAIRRLAGRLREASASSPAGAAAVLATLPDVGASRLEHGRWLERGARLVGSRPGAASAATLQQVARQWDLLVAVAQEHEIDTRSGRRPRAFLERKLRHLPELVLSIAEREERSMFGLAEVL